MMRRTVLALSTLALLAGCNTTSPRLKDTSNLTSLDTLMLCKIALTEPEENYRVAATKLAVRRGATLEKCQRIIANDQAIMTGIVIVGAGVTAGAAAQSGGYGSSYGAAWDRFPNGQWRCRDRGNGRFLPDYRCSGLPMYDAWP